MSSRCVDCLNESIERCSVTGVTLCAEHLWYVEDGRRVSERVAQQMRASGRAVYSPQHYLEQLGVEYPLPTLPRPPGPRIRTLPNGYDLFGWAALVMCVTSLLAGWLAASGQGAVWAAVIVPHLACAWAARRYAARAVHVEMTRALGTAGLIVSAGCALGLAAISAVLDLSGV